MTRHAPLHIMLYALKTLLAITLKDYQNDT